MRILKLLSLILIAISFKNTNAQNWTLQFKDSIEVFWDINFADTLTGWAVGDQGVILSTKNGGDNWSLQKTNTTKMVLGITSLNTNKVIAVGDSGLILVTGNGGTTWTQIESGTKYCLWKSNFIDSLNGWIVGAERSPGGNTPYTYSIILHTENGGMDWVQIGDSIHGGFVDIQFVTQKKGWIAGTNEFFDNLTPPWIYNTTDGGLTWEQQHLPYNIGPLRSICFVDSNNGWAVGLGMSLNNLVYKTTDGGINWLGTGWVEEDSVTLPFAFSDIYFNNKNEGWIAGGKFIYRTTNGGDSWSSKTDIDLKGGRAIHSPRIGFAWSIYAGEIWRYRDNPVSVDNELEIVDGFYLNQNYPNPFNNSTVITFTLLKESFVKLEIFDLLGNLVKIILHVELGKGKYQYHFNGIGLASGIYYCNLRVGEYKKTCKMIYLK